jgi:AcrR family transcriptional regulator
VSASPSPPQEEPARLDRRARRRQETIEEILEISVVVMTEEGVNGLSLSEVARRLGVQPPSLYKYFPSLHAVYDAIFERGQRENLEVMRSAMADAEPGLDALTKGLEASGRWALDNQAVAQLLFWRPVPSFEPSAEALAPSHEMVALQQQAMNDAVDAGELGEGARDVESVYLVSTFIMGTLSQAMANEPGLAWGKGRFTPLFPTLMGLLVAAYPPATKKAPSRRGAAATRS